MSKKAEDRPADDAGVRQMQERVAEADAQGFVGQKVDPTPNAAYTFGGQAADAPTPETDGAAAVEAEHAAGLGAEARVDGTEPE